MRILALIKAVIVMWLAIYGVQAIALAPVQRALEAGLDTVPPVEVSAPSVAEGVAIADPVRGRRLLQAIRESEGTCLVVDDEAILKAQEQLARRGLYVEPTSATAIAALENLLPRVKPGDTVVVPLTGNGLKGTPALI